MTARRGIRNKANIEWDFMSFPVFWAVAIGGLIATLVTAFFGPALPFVASLFGFSFGLSHLVFHSLRKRTIEKDLARKEEDEIERRVLAQRAHADSTGTSSRRARRRRRS